MPLRLYNTLTKRVEPFIPSDPARVTFYSCGPTVYDDAHIGNFRSFLAADLLRRFVESPLCEVADGKGGAHKGPRQVVHVMNITDVGHMTDDAEGGEQGEDRMAVAGRRIAEAKKSGKLPAGVEVDPSDPYQIARFYEGRFAEDARALGLKLAIEAVQDPSLMPRATENVPGMIAAIQRLLARDCAYVVGQPGQRVVYFDVQKFPQYGRLSGNSLDRLREGEGGRISAVNQAGKRHPADFLLWKEDTSHIMKWNSPWGEGFPGWHIECTAMSIGRLVGIPPEGRLLASSFTHPGAVIDLHSGGEDNIFPHHECEIAQTCCAYTDSTLSGTLSRMWFHPRFLLVEGDKMSKSKGNFYTPRDLFDKGIEPAALRLELIKTHYRSNANFTIQGLEDSRRQFRGWLWRFHDVMGAMPGVQASVAMRALDAARASSAQFASALDDDLNVALGIAILHGTFANVCQILGVIPSGTEATTPVPSWIRDKLNSAIAMSSPSSPQWEILQHLGQMSNVLGVLDSADPVGWRELGIGVFAPGISPSEKVLVLLGERAVARAVKDFAAADRIRDELTAAGYAIKDIAGGKVEVSRQK